MLKLALSMQILTYLSSWIINQTLGLQLMPLLSD